jgi:hypothetical protein
MKLLLGIKAAENKHRNNLFIRKKNGWWFTHYATIERGQYFYVSRPLKFIELTRDKDVLSLDIKVKGIQALK